MKKTIRAKAVLSALILMALFMTINENVNAGWSEMECSTDQWMTNLWGTTDTNIYAVGGRGEIFRYDGDGDNDSDPDEIWEEMTSGTSHDLFAIWGSSDSNIYVVGHTGTVRHYDGTGWTNIAGEV